MKSAFVIMCAAAVAGVIYDRTQNLTWSLWGGGVAACFGLFCLIFRSVLGVMLKTMVVMAILSCAFVAGVVFMESNGILFDQPVVKPRLELFWDTVMRVRQEAS